MVIPRISRFPDLMPDDYAESDLYFRLLSVSDKLLKDFRYDICTSARGAIAINIAAAILFFILLDIRLSF